MPPAAVALIVLGLLAAIGLAWRHHFAHQHEWHRHGTKMRRKRPDGSFEYREETGREGKDDQEMNAW